MSCLCCYWESSFSGRLCPLQRLVTVLGGRGDLLEFLYSQLQNLKTQLSQTEVHYLRRGCLDLHVCKKTLFIFISMVSIVFTYLDKDEVLHRESNNSELRSTCWKKFPSMIDHERTGNRPFHSSKKLTKLLHEAEGWPDTVRNNKHANQCRSYDNYFHSSNCARLTPHLHKGKLWNSLFSSCHWLEPLSAIFFTQWPLYRIILSTSREMQGHNTKIAAIFRVLEILR